MTPEAISKSRAVGQEAWQLTRIASFPKLRVLAWSGNVLYASRGYELLRLTVGATLSEWETVSRYTPTVWRSITSKFDLSSRLFRDGFHALAVLSSGHIVAAVPGAIVTVTPGERDARVSWRVSRGTRPLHIAAGPDDHLFWGEYFDNPDRDEVHIYVSTDRGATWNVAYTFSKGSIRHVHNIVYDEHADCFWLLTGDDGPECRILRASRDFHSVEAVLSGSQQARAAALVPMKDAIHFSSDTPQEQNHVYRLDRAGAVTAVSDLTSSSIYGCRVGDAVFFSTMVEPSTINCDPYARIFGARHPDHWSSLLAWKKDLWPARAFQYGSIFLPDGKNCTDVLAVSTIAVCGGAELSLWRIDSC